MSHRESFSLVRSDIPLICNLFSHRKGYWIVIEIENHRWSPSPGLLHANLHALRIFCLLKYEDHGFIQVGTYAFLILVCFISFHLHYWCLFILHFLRFLLSIHFALHINYSTQHLNSLHQYSIKNELWKQLLTGSLFYYF